MADAMEAFRQNMDQEMADELARLERHGFVAARVPGGNQHCHACRVEGHRWAIEDSFETAKPSWARSQETRFWHGWRRHVSLVMLAFAMMAAIRHGQHRDGPANDAWDLCGSPLIRWSIQEIRRIAARLPQSRVPKPHAIAWSHRQRLSCRSKAHPSQGSSKKCALP
jgi:SRSO17 transposase